MGRYFGLVAAVTGVRFEVGVRHLVLDFLCGEDTFTGCWAVVFTPFQEGRNAIGAGTPLRQLPSQVPKPFRRGPGGGEEVPAPVDDSPHHLDAQGNKESPCTIVRPQQGDYQPTSA